MPKGHSSKFKIGRPRGSNTYGESTTPVRIPNSKLAVISDYLQRCAFRKNIDAIDPDQIVKSEPAGRPVTLPLYSAQAARFSFSADDHIEKRLNIHEYLVKQEESTFMVTITGLSMRDAGLLLKDIAVVDRSKTAAVGQIVLAVVDGEFTIKQLGMTEEGQPMLLPANPDFKPIKITDGMSFKIWGVVTGSVRKYA